MKTGRQPHRQSTLKRFQVLLLSAFAVATTAFLLKLPYLPAGWISGCTFLLMMAGYGYLRMCYKVSVPPGLVGLLIGAVAVDVLGNYLHLYGQRFGPVMYDEFSHFVASALTIPAIIWILRELIERRGHHLSLGVITLFAITCALSADAYYEVIELWDELYFGGQRIWGPYDAPRDLQWDLAGILFGALITCGVMRARARQGEPKTSGRPL